MSLLYAARLLVRELLPDHCGIDAPWFDHGDPETRDLHRLALRVLRGHNKRLVQRSLPMRFGRQAAAIMWPANAAARSLAILARLGAKTEREFGVGVTTQLRQLLRAANRHNIAPKSYYKFRLFDPANKARVPHFMQEHEVGATLSLIRRRLETQSEQVDHKYSFWRFCVANDLPVIPVLAFGEPAGAMEWHTSAEELPRDDIILKRTNFAQAEGLECWVYDPERDQWQHGGRRLDEQELCQHFATVMTEHGAVVQPRIRNHPAMQPVAPKALSGIRVVTALDDSGIPRVVAASLRVGVGDSFVDNCIRGGIAVHVDAATGRLGMGVGGDIGSGWYHRHPDTGAIFSDTRLPMWDRVRETCVRAHACAKELPTVGWDIAITADGPTFVEANTLWSGDLIQSGGVPLSRMLLRALHRALAAPPSEFDRLSGRG